MFAEKRGEHCPLSPDEVKNLNATLKSIDERLSNIEKWLFAGRAIFYVLGGILLFSGWVVENLSNFRLWLKS